MQERTASDKETAARGEDQIREPDTPLRLGGSGRSRTEKTPPSCTLLYPSYILTACTILLFFLCALWFKGVHDIGDQKGEENIFNHASIVNQIPLLRIQRELVYAIYSRLTKKQPDGDILQLNTSYTACSVQSKQQSSRKVNSSQQFQWSSSPSVCEQTQSVESMSSHWADVSVSPMFDWWASMPNGADYQVKVGPPAFYKANWEEWLRIFFIISLWTFPCPIPTASTHYMYYMVWWAVTFVDKYEIYQYWYLILYQNIC